MAEGPALDTTKVSSALLSSKNSAVVSLNLLILTLIMQNTRKCSSFIPLDVNSVCMLDRF